MHVLRRRGVALLTAALAFTVVPVTAAALAMPALAATSCTSNSTVTKSGLRFTIPSVGTNTNNFNCVLGVGNHSSAVRNLQAHLNACYYRNSQVAGHHNVLNTVLAVDGDYGNLTRSAVAAVQRHHGISDDGTYGPATRRTILFHADNGGAGLCRQYGA
jgi:peptidoglycan hydrolase-like protein with peptidoglycan-binding domain